MAKPILLVAPDGDPIDEPSPAAVLRLLSARWHVSGPELARRVRLAAPDDSDWLGRVSDRAVRDWLSGRSGMTVKVLTAIAPCIAPDVYPALFLTPPSVVEWWLKVNHPELFSADELVGVEWPTAVAAA